MSLNNLRDLFFDFFESKGHLKLDSFSLVPEKNERSLLLINSGMAPMKEWFLGVSVPKSKRVVTCQKCVRTVDLQNVGKTDRHGTFFEMLGNFSFGDYFKTEAVSFAWEFVTKVLKMPEHLLYVTIFEDDDEAQSIWQKQGVPLGRIVKLGKEDNFWEIGKGPCGPCSELYFDRGTKFGCGLASCGPGCDCDRFVEFWNLVFSQFCSDGNGHYEGLSQKNIDTGMGLERLACIVQGVNNLFEVDSVKKILLRVCELAGVTYGQSNETDSLVRIIVDHVRSSVFLISDGVLVSNEGRGYVLRRLIRRAISSAYFLKIRSGFLGELASEVVEQSKFFYKELPMKLNYIKQVLNFEEQNFQKILSNGHKLFDELVVDLKLRGETKISASQAFKLCDTFGMPYDLLLDLAKRNNFEVDCKGFEECLEKQKSLARFYASKKVKGWKFKNFDVLGLKSEFVGYDVLKCKARLCAIFLEDEAVRVVNVGQKAHLVFDKTSFYAQGGGQVADCGFIKKQGIVVANVLNCHKLSNGVLVHEVVTQASLNLNETYDLEVDEFKRQAVARNHTSAHILQQVLINLLGEHVHQAGQLVDFKKMRFDFSHFNALTVKELVEVEQKVNEVILNNLKVETKLMSLSEAKQCGAKALFNEKYGNEVRVVEIGNFSKELCGGTHVKNSSEIGLFKIVSQSSVGTGIRRIEAVTGYESLKMVQCLNDSCELVCKTLKAKNLNDVVLKINDIQTRLKNSDANLNKLKLKISVDVFKKNLQINYFDRQSLNLAVFDLNLLSAKLLKSFAQSLIDEDENLILLICSSFENKFTFLVACAKTAVVNGLNSGVVVKALAELVNKKGGGRANLAMAGLESAAEFEVIKQNFVGVVSKQLIK